MSKPLAWMYTDRWGTHFTEDKREILDGIGIEEFTPLGDNQRIIFWENKANELEHDRNNLLSQLDGAQDIAFRASEAHVITMGKFLEAESVIKELLEEYRALDLPYGSKAYQRANEFISDKTI